jgi:glucose-1-phosphate thymidylyltransferase
MKALVLAAGYATRLYPLTKDRPKPLLKVGDKAIVEHILEKIESLSEIDEVFIVTNDRFYQHFVNWQSNYTYSKKITLVNDGTLSNEDRLGAVGDLNYVINKESIDDDLLVIAGDNLFGFSLQKFMNTYNGRSMVALRDLKDVEKVRNKYGVAVTEGSKVVQFQEKPAEPLSSLASTACYIFSSDDLLLVNSLVEQGIVDNPGDLIVSLVESSEIHGFVFDEHWFDIGSHESLKEAEEMYREN